MDIICSAHFERNLDDDVPKEQETLERYFDPCNRARYSFSKISSSTTNAPTPVFFITIGTLVFFEKAKAAVISPGVCTSIK